LESKSSADHGPRRANECGNNLGLSENPFTGEKLDRYGARVRSVSVGPDVLVRNLVVEGVFPALCRTISIGRATLQNTGSNAITGLSVRLFVSLKTRI
jgi:hypothetical protein